MITADSRALNVFESRHHNRLPDGMKSYLKLRYGGVMIPEQEPFQNSQELQEAMDQELHSWRAGEISSGMLEAADRVISLHRILCEQYNDLMTSHLFLCQSLDDAETFIYRNELFEDFEDYTVKGADDDESVHC